MHYKSFLTGFIVGALFVPAALTLSSCKTQRKVNEQLTVHATNTLLADSASIKYSETHYFGDMLTGSSYLPLFFDTSATNTGDSIQAESGGVKVKFKLTPKKDKNGNTTGYQIDYSGQAKPTAKTSTYEAQQGHRHETASTDSTKSVTSTTTTTKGINLPSWGWAMAIIILIIILICFGRSILSYIKNLNPLSWIKKI